MAFSGCVLEASVGESYYQYPTVEDIVTHFNKQPTIHAVYLA
jgi:hypothetical protein